MFDKNTPIPFGSLQGKKLSEIEDEMAIRNWLVYAPGLCKNKADMDVLNFIGRHMDGEQWVPYRMKLKKDDSYVVGFGQYKGKRLSEISSSELYSYCQFLHKGDQTPNSKEFITKAIAFLTAL